MDAIVFLILSVFSVIFDLAEAFLSSGASFCVRFKKKKFTKLIRIKIMPHTASSDC